MKRFNVFFFMGDSILFQLRSQSVNDYKGLVDITVGGHLNSTETAKDGVREIEEELGLQVSFERLKFLCTIAETIEDNEMHFVDKEFLKIYTLEVTEDDVKEIKYGNEVEDLIKIDKNEFNQFCLGRIKNCTGYSQKKNNKIELTKGNFFPYSEYYFICLSTLLNHQ